MGRIETRINKGIRISFDLPPVRASTLSHSTPVKDTGIFVDDPLVPAEVPYFFIEADIFVTDTSGKERRIFTSNGRMGAMNVSAEGDITLMPAKGKDGAQAEIKLDPIYKVPFARSKYIRTKDSMADIQKLFRQVRLTEPKAAPPVKFGERVVNKLLELIF